MVWNNRILHYSDGGFGIHEVYYRDNGFIEGYTQNSVGCVGNDLVDLRSDYNQKAEAFITPILDQVKIDAGERDPQKAIWQPPVLSSGRKGLAGGALEQVTGVGADWSYRWYINPEAFNVSYEHIPMIRPGFNAAIARDTAIAHPGSYWLVFNEPDYYYQDRLRPVDAALIFTSAFNTIYAVDKTAKFIVGGLYWITNTAWLSDFFNLVTVGDGSIVGVHVHHYAIDPTKYNKDVWRNELIKFRQWVDVNRSESELWITEFGCLPNTFVAKQLMVDQVPWLKAQSWVTRFAWYSAYNSTQQGSLYISNTSAQMTELGILYKGM